MKSLAFWCRILSSSLLAFVLLDGISAASADSAAATAGENIFKSNCVLCHGTDATGNTPLGTQLKARNLHSAAVQKKTNAELKKIITSGEGNMPPFAAQLSSAQIDEVLAYVRQLGKSKK